MLHKVICRCVYHAVPNVNSRHLCLFSYIIRCLSHSSLRVLIGFTSMRELRFGLHAGNAFSFAV